MSHKIEAPIQLKGGHTAEDPRLGRVPSFDEQSRDYDIKATLEEHDTVGVIHNRAWYNPLYLNQERTSACTGESRTYDLAGSPAPLRYTADLLAGLTKEGHPLDKKPGERLDQDFAQALYRIAQKYDEWPGEDYEGSSVLGACKAAQAVGLIGEYRWAFNIDDMCSALSTLCEIVVGTTWYNCLAADQRVLTQDLDWVPVQKIQPGDKLVGFSGIKNGDSVYCPATVIDNSKQPRPCVEVKTERGTITVSEDHLFVLCDRDRGRRWVKAKDLKPEDRLAYFMDPYDWDQSYESGWLAGFFDGEGSVSCGSVTVAQKPGQTWEMLLKVASYLGIDLCCTPNDQTGVMRACVKGDYAAGLNFLGRVRPSRLLPKAQLLWNGRRTHNRSAPPVLVERIKRVASEYVYGIGTTSQTLVTEGLLSHNSMFDPRPDGTINVDPSSGEAGGHAYCFRRILASRASIQHYIGHGEKVREGVPLLIVRNSWWNPFDGSSEWGRRGEAGIWADDYEAHLFPNGEQSVVTTAFHDA